MRRRVVSARWSTLLLLSGILAQPALAETLTVACDADQRFNAPEMTLVYEGEAEGTLTVTAPFGEMSLPARREEREWTDEKGVAATVTGILGSGRVKMQMPDKAAVESCVKGKLPPDQLADSDMVFVTVMGCVAEVAPGAEPVEVDAYASIALLPEAYVEFKRTFAEPTELAVGKIELQAFPDCTIKE
jgi:hypothetical protein